MPLVDFFTTSSLFGDFDHILYDALSRGTWQIGEPQWHTQVLEGHAPQGLRPRVPVREDKEKNVVSRLVPVPQGIKPEDIKMSNFNIIIVSIPDFEFCV